MFSQNVFSARDVQVNSALSDNNAWDSQQYSQAMYSSQNSQLSSMDMFSQQKGSIPSKFDQYQRSQSQTTEDEPPNYYSKYVSNAPLFPTSSNNNKLKRSMQAFIKEEKQNISMKEERDTLQTFVNLLKDYTKEVDSSFTNFKNDMETTLQAIVKNIQDGSQRIDDKVTNLKEELVSIIEAKSKDVQEKRELNKNISEQTGTIKVLETKAEILEKQVDEMKNKESAYVDQKSKFQELEQKYLQCINQWNANQASCLGNTPPLSQHTLPLCGYQIPTLQHDQNVDPGTCKTFSNKAPSSGYEYNLWQTEQTNDYYNPMRNNPGPMILQNLPVNPIINPTLPIHPTVNPNLSYGNNTDPVACTPNLSYSIVPVAQARSTSTTSHLTVQNSMNCQLPTRAEQLYSTPNKTTPASAHCSKVRNTGSPTPRSCGLKISRRNSKRPKQSPMAMVKPLVRKPVPLLDDEIFLVDIIDHPETSCSMEPLLDMDKKNPNPSKLAESAKHTPQQSEPFIRNTDSDVKKKWCRQEDTVKRKRTSVSMLGVSSDDSEVQEIANLLREQSRHFSKRTKSMP